MPFPTKDQRRLSLTISLDGEQVFVDIDADKSVGDAIRQALILHDIVERADHCHLAGPERIYSSKQRVRDIDHEAPLALRLPL